MTRLRPLALAALASIATLAACSSSSSPGGAGPANHEVAKSALARDTAPALTAAEQAAIASDSDALTTDLLARLPADGNLAYSPFSVGVALSMLYAGAKGNTAAEMATALHWSLPQDRVAKAYDWTTLELAGRADAAYASAVAKNQGNPGAAAPDRANFRLHVVNSLWADKRMTFVPAFLDTMAVNYGAGVTLADFAGNPDGERQAINTWVSDETLGKITNLLPEGSVSADTVVALVNAIHLKLPWPAPLTPSASPKTFNLGSGGSVNVTYVGDIVTAGYYDDGDVTAVKVPLEGGKVSMIFALPKSQLHAFESGLTAAKLATIRGGMQNKQVDLQLPKFKFTTDSLSLSDALKAMGMKLAFQAGAADFSGMGSTGNPLYVSGVFHKAMIGLDEKGVEAAAATAVLVSDTSVPLADVTFRADKPFFFAIVDEPTQSTLFAGRVVDPTK